MGLDMYINNKSITEGDNEVAYWRKHRELHNIFEDIATDKGIKYDSFNCVPVPLTVSDIDYILNTYKDNKEILDDYTKEQLIHCKFLIGTGANLEYNSWW